MLFSDIVHLLLPVAKNKRIYDFVSICSSGGKYTIADTINMIKERIHTIQNIHTVTNEVYISGLLLVLAIHASITKTHRNYYVTSNVNEKKSLMDIEKHIIASLISVTNIKTLSREMLRDNMHLTVTNTSIS